MLILAGAGINQ